MNSTIQFFILVLKIKSKKMLYEEELAGRFVHPPLSILVLKENFKNWIGTIFSIRMVGGTLPSKSYIPSQDYIGSEVSKIIQFTQTY